MRILITENQLNFLILEQSTGPGGYMVTATDSPASTKSSTFQDILNQKNMSFEEFIEEFREKLYSPAGIAIESFLSAFGVPEIPIVAYAGLTAWDVYQSFEGKEIRWGDLFFDLLGLVSAGVISGILAPFRSQISGAKSLEQVIKFFQKTKVWDKIGGLIKSLSTGLSKILSQIVKGVTWVSKKLGVTAIFKSLSKISKFIEDTTTKLVTLLGGTQKLSKATGVGTKIYAQNVALIGGTKAVMDINQKSNDSDLPKIDFNYKPTEEELEIARNMKFDN